MGTLTPSAEKWQRILTAGGGKVAITQSKLSIDVRSLVEDDQGEAGLRLCILPDDYPTNRKSPLVKFCEKWGYMCVYSCYVGNDGKEMEIVMCSCLTC